METTDTPALYANPRHPYTEALFHALPEKSAETRERLYSIQAAQYRQGRAVVNSA